MQVIAAVTTLLNRWAGHAKGILTLSRWLPGLLPLLGALVMFAASTLPWLRDPLGTTYNAWDIPLHLGWAPLQGSILNYGLLSLGCTLLCCGVAITRWHKDSPKGGSSSLYAGLLCLLPILLFLFQYQCVDLAGLDTLAQHKVQALLIQQHFGYKLPGDLYQIQPLSISDTQSLGRFQVLINQLGSGLFLPLVSAWLLLSNHYLFPPSTRARRSNGSNKRRRWLLLAGLLVALVFFGRAPAALASDFQAKQQLALGDYTSATRWLDAAAILNPQISEVAYYHIQRGQAWYFLHPDKESADSHAYLAWVYRQQGNNVGAYQELLASQSAQTTLPQWGTSEMNTTLIDLAETVQHQNGPPIQRMAFDATVIPWLDKLLLLDPNNVYGHYVLGHIQYDLHNFDTCIAQMTVVLNKSTNRDIRSSAYTYMALSLQGQGNKVGARQMLLQAIQLDPEYRNNTAREEISGLH